MFPKKGINSNINFTYYPKLLDYKIDFSRIAAGISGIFSFKTFTDFILILSGSGEKLFGTYPFFEAAALGGIKNLRGFPRERFQGDAMISGQSDLKIKIASVNLFLPSTFGISGMSDIGRVFVKGENSEKWHNTYGGGLWLEIAKMALLNFTIAHSPEITKYYFSFGVGF